MVRAGSTPAPGTKPLFESPSTSCFRSSFRIIVCGVFSTNGVWFHIGSIMTASGFVENSGSLMTVFGLIGCHLLPGPALIPPLLSIFTGEAQCSRREATFACREPVLTVYGALAHVDVVMAAERAALHVCHLLLSLCALCFGQLSLSLSVAVSRSSIGIGSLFEPPSIG